MAVLEIKQFVDVDQEDSPVWRWWRGITWSRLWLGPTDIEFAAASWIDYEGDLHRETVKTLHPPLV